MQLLAGSGKGKLLFIPSIELIESAYEDELDIETKEAHLRFTFSTIS